MRTTFGLLCVALIVSMFVNYRLYLTLEHRREEAPLSEWMMRLDINHLAVVESGDVLSGRVLDLVQKSIYMDIVRINEQKELNPRRFGPARIDRFRAILDNLNRARQKTPGLFASPKLQMPDSQLADYIELISTDEY